MAKIDLQDTIAILIDKHFESQPESSRSHLGPSLLGDPCERKLWLSFRWAVIEKFPGRILRVFRRGQNEEALVVSDLRRIGMDVRSTGAQQSRVDFGNHVSGSIDGVIHSGVPEAPQKMHVLEIKTHSLKSFNELSKKGVQESHPKHYDQMQMYMLGMKIDRALYVAVCKDDDRIHTERVRLDKEHAQKLVAKGHRIVSTDRLPPPISTDPSWYECKFCAAHDFCHGSKLTQEVNCRTCAHSTAKPDSTWRCERHDADGIPVEFQREGCESHVIHPDLTPWKRLDSGHEWIALYEINGKLINNGEPDASCFSSKELIGNLSACLNQDEFIQEARTGELQARIARSNDEPPF